MRTTITLDDDLVARLKVVARERGVPFQVVLSDAVRAGLAGAAGLRPYRVPDLNLAVRPGIDLVKALRLATELEDRQLLREMALGKRRA